MSAQLTDTRSIHRKFIVKDLTCLIVYQTGVPIPIPIWFDQLGYKHHGLEGVRGQFVLGNNLAALNMGTLVKGLCDLYKELRRFFTDAAHALPADLFQRNGINLGVHAKPGFVQLPKYLGGALLGSEQELFNLGVDQLLVPVANFLKKPDIGKLLAVVPLQLRHGSFGADAPLRIGPFEPQAAWLVSTLREFDGLVEARSRQRNAFVDGLYAGGAAAGDASVQALRGTVSAATGGEVHEGVVAFARGSLNVPTVRCSLNVFAGVLAARGRGLATQFRLTGEVGPLLALDVGGRVAVTQRPAAADRPATAELVAAGDLELRVLGYSVLNAGFSLQDGELAFAGGLSLFPPDSAFKVKGDVSGRIGRDRLRVDGQVELALGPLPAARAGLSLSYEHVALHVSWFDQDWTLTLGRRLADQVAFSARANRPVPVLPGLVTLLDATDDERGPSLELVGPRDASLALSGRVTIPALRMTGRGSLSISPGRVVGAAGGELYGVATALALRGESLDKPASFSFSAEFKGDLFAQISEQLHAGFSALMAGARKLADDAERVFNEAWATFRGLVERGANAIRAGILETKANIERLIGELEKAADGVISALRVKDDEIAARKAFLDALREGAQRGLQWFEDRARELRTSLAAKRHELADHDAWYGRLNAGEQFLNWGYYTARRIDLLIATEVLPGLLRLAEQELAKAREGVPLLADQADAMLQQLDRLRNGFADELSRHKQAIVDRRRELDHYNELLLSGADDLVRKFGQAVDDTVMKASKKSFDLARSVVGDLEAARENFRRLGRPFDVERLRIEGRLGAQVGARFEARADIVVNTSSTRKVVQDLGFALDLEDLPGTAAGLAKDLWDRRDSLKAIDHDEYQRAKAQKLEQEYAAVVVERAQRGPEFGETLDKKLLLDMKWTELAEFHHYLQKNVARSSVIGDAAALTSVFQDVLERYREAAAADRLSSHVRGLVQQANPGLQFDVVDPAANLKRWLDLLLQMLQEVLRRAAEPGAAGTSFAAQDAVVPVFRLANLANVRWDEVPGNEDGLIAGSAAALSFDTAVQGPRQLFRLPGAVLFKGPDFSGETMLVLHVGESMGFDMQIHSLVALPGHRVKVYVEGAPPGVPMVFTGCVTLPASVTGRAEVERVDLTAELPPPQLAAWAALATDTPDALWSRGRAVRYAVAFEFPDGRLLRSGWWSTVGQGAIDADGYVAVGSLACPMLSGISRDPTGKAVARRVYRQVRGEPEVQVARIANNVDTTWTEPVPAPVRPPPPVFKTWLASVPVAGSPVWRPGFGVRYAVEFEYAGGKVVRSDWWQAERQVAGDGHSYHDYAFPQMTLPVDPIGQAVARRVVRQFAGLPERVVARVADDAAREWTDRDLGTRDRPTPPPALRDWLVSLPVEGSPVWKAGFGVRYALEFEYADGVVVRSGWWQAERQVDGDGYSFHDYALPRMTLPVDPTGQAVARRVVRQFKGRPERMLVRVANNTDTEWTDRDRGSADVPPARPGLVFFVANLPVAGSPVWRSGYGVRYAVEFEYADGAAVRSPWWLAQTQDADDYSHHWFAFPRITLPRDPTGEAVARRVIRQFIGLPERVLARITNNTDTEWTDTDRGLADKPLAPLTVNLWSTSLPVAGSPVWRSGCRVRYAVEFEYTDGTVLRTDWWRTDAQDGDGYAAPAYAMPQLRLPVDPTGMVAARRVVREFAGLPARVVARIANNTDTLWTDTDRGAADNPPSPPTTITWSANLPVAGSPVWQPGFRVRYAVAYEYADGTVVRGGWWRTAEPQDGEGYVTSGYAMPVLGVAADASGQVVARRMIRQFLGQPERVVARLVDNGVTSWCDRDIGAVDMPPPPPPTGNCWSANLPIAGSPVWRPGFRVRYAVAFEYADGTVTRSDWWRTAEDQDGERYVSSSYAMPVLNIPADPSGQVVARRMIRQFIGRPERVVGRIANNVEPTWRDADSGTADASPPAPPTVNGWSQALPVAGSPAWQPGVRVRYAVAFEFADGTVVRGDGWRTAEPQDGEGYAAPAHAMPVLNIPADPSGQVVARRVIRQFLGRPERVVGRVADNTAPTWADTDAGFADMPPRPGLNVWAAHLPVAGSPLWQPGLAVRYAVVYEFADGSAARSPWNDDDDGYLSSEYYAVPVLSVACDPSGRVVARRVIRQCRGRPERVVGRIADNTASTWADTDAGFADMPPRPGLHVWAANLPVAGSPLWQPGFAVRYAVVYEFADGSTARSPWNDEHDGYLSSEYYAFPVLSIPCDPSGRVVARRVIRQCRGRPERELGRIADNAEPGWTDADMGLADMPSLAMSGLYAAQRESMEAFFVHPDGTLGFAYQVAPGLDLQSFRGAGIVTGGVAAVFARQRQHAEVFAVGQGGRLHYFHMNPDWRRESDAFSAAAPITGPIAAVFGEVQDHSEVFVVGGDGHLQRFYRDGGWRHEREPFRVAGPVRGLAVAYSQARAHAEVYAVDGAGTLHFFHGEGGTWRHSRVPGVKVDGAISAVYSPRRGHTEAFFRGDDGRLHFVYAESGQWRHEHAAFAGMGAVTGALAATFAPLRQESEVFLRGEDGRLRYVFCHQGVWMVDADTFAPGGAVAGGIAAIFNPKHNHSEVMFLGAGGSLHHFSIPGLHGWVHAVKGV